MDPLIVTLRFDAASFAHFDTLRRRHFPAGRNLIPAHLTLFHHLPPDDPAAVAAALDEAGRGETPMRLSVTGLRFLGYGSAFAIASPDLARLRAALARRFADDLTPQDRQGFRPHVTIQNKAPAAAAKALFSELDSAFRPFEATGIGLDLWHYRGGPWESAAFVPFAGREAEDPETPEARPARPPR